MFVIRNSLPLPITEKLFRHDPYLTECDAEVLYVQDDLVVTNRTIFYAESGGQVADRGWIDDVEVTDVQKTPGRRTLFIRASDNRFGVDGPTLQVETLIVHRCANPSRFVPGQKVRMRINWPIRYAHMRNHSAAHFVYHAVKVIYGRVGVEPFTKGCFIHDTSARFDFSGRLDSELIPEVEALANDLIAKGHDIRMESDTRTDEVFYWLYGDIVIPCGGTHVRTAKEVGPLDVRRKSQGQSLTRIYVTLKPSA